MIYGIIIRQIAGIVNPGNLPHFCSSENYGEKHFETFFTVYGVGMTCGHNN